MKKGHIFVPRRHFQLLLLSSFLLLVTSNAGIHTSVHASLETSDNLFSTPDLGLESEGQVKVVPIHGPPTPPVGYPRPAVSLPASDPAAGVVVLDVPAYRWFLGCSATAGAMIAAYYDRNGYPELYTGPTGNGLMPLDSSIWPDWTDGHGDTYGQCPLTASHLGLDGRTTRGTIDDYWVAVDSAANDPFLTHGWTEHTWGEAIGDFMKTSQSEYDNLDGLTTFYYWLDDPSPLTCADMLANGYLNDGTLGRRLFYEARGYTVTDCYNQDVDSFGGGFTFAMYRAEIDAGRPVMLNLKGHTVVGLGYDASTGSVYIHDTWDTATHSMPWGGSYLGMELQSVNIVNLAPLPLPGEFGKTSPTNGSTDQPLSLDLSWTASSGAAAYEYCVDTSDDGTCSPWVSTGTNTSVTLTDLLPTTAYSWQVRATNLQGNTPADGDPAAFWSFTTRSYPLLQDPGFEAYTPNPYWLEASSTYGTPLCRLSDCGSGGGRAGPHSGEVWAWFGGLAVDGLSTASLSQTFLIPPGSSPLQFHLWIGAADPGSDVDDSFSVSIDGSTVFFADATQIGLYPVYTPVSVDITPFADGRAHNLVFSSHISDQYVNFSLDDISLASPPAPIFVDVPLTHWAAAYISQLYQAGITAGCSLDPLLYCPEYPVTRAQMAVFLERGLNGETFTPPGGTGLVFGDVPQTHWAAGWVEKLFADGITAGCSINPLNYCPENPVTRSEMAVFLLRTKHGSAYTPPAANGIFEDVPAAYWAADWIEQLAVEGITAGCSTTPLLYCPEEPVTRAQMAVFLVRAFELP